MKKKSPAEAGVSSTQFGVIFKTGIGGDRVAVQLRLALLDAIRAPGVQKQSKIAQLYLLATPSLWRKVCPPNYRSNRFARVRINPINMSFYYSPFS